jgi:hypothetical protein
LNRLSRHSLAEVVESGQEHHLLGVAEHGDIRTLPESVRTQIKE